MKFANLCRYSLSLITCPVLLGLSGLAIGAFVLVGCSESSTVDSEALSSEEIKTTDVNLSEINPE